MNPGIQDPWYRLSTTYELVRRLLEMEAHQ